MPRRCARHSSRHGQAVQAGRLGVQTALPRSIKACAKSPARTGTSAEANAFPAGLLVGTVHYASETQPMVNPAANLERLEIVRIFNYGLGGIVPPEAPGRALMAGPQE